MKLPKQVTPFFAMPKSASRFSQRQGVVAANGKLLDQLSFPVPKKTDLVFPGPKPVFIGPCGDVSIQNNSCRIIGTTASGEKIVECACRSTCS